MNIFDFAINMELEGEKYYKEQAERNKDNSLSKVFQVLAKDENMHAKVLQNKSGDLNFELLHNKTLSQAKNIFDEIGTITLNNYDDQIDAYKHALEKEKESIDFYKNYLSEVKDDETQKLFEILVKQEEEHYEIIEQIISLILKSEEWVESAEFGLREEY